MSQYNFTNDDGKYVIYGLDKSTGGYFYTIFDFEDEPEVEKHGLGFNEFIRLMKEDLNFEKTWLKGIMIDDFVGTMMPSPLQIEIYKQFGKGDLVKKLAEVFQEIEEELRK